MINIQSGYLKTKNGIQLMTTVPYPIGAIYLSVDNTNPSKLFGGTWEQIARGRTLVGVDTSDTEFNKVKKTSRTKDTHLQYVTSGAWGLQPGSASFANRLVVGKAGLNQETFDKGNLQLYFTCYIWCHAA